MTVRLTESEAAELEAGRLDDEPLSALLRDGGLMLVRGRVPGCVCKGHRHEGGVGGCYFGGTLVPRCPCRWTND